MEKIIYAEIYSSDNTVRVIDSAPFVPNFKGSVYCVDISDFDPQPGIGDTYDPDTGTFSAPPPPPDPDAAYMGMLTLQSVTGGTFSQDMTELNCHVAEPVQVKGTLSILDGSTTLELDMPTLRLPLVPTDMEGNTIEGAQPSMAAATINKGQVTASWTPEFTGTYAITEESLNVRLPHGAKLKFTALQIFVLP